jgi:hypothetical protein
MPSQVTQQNINYSIYIKKGKFLSYHFFWKQIENNFQIQGKRMNGVKCTYIRSFIIYTLK